MKNIPAIGRDFTEEEIRSFVGDLESVRGGELTVSLLVGCGERAIAPLQEYLLHGKPRWIFQPRQRAVEALAQLGAKEVLMEYLSQKRELSDAAVRFGEETVENTAARELSRWPTEDVYQFVMHRAKQRMLEGLIETLGEFERPEAAPDLIRALEDGICRPIAGAALRKIAPSVKPLLFTAAKKRMTEDGQRPCELARRRLVLHILSELDISKEEWGNLRSLLQDEDLEVRLTAAQIALDTAPFDEKRTAATLLMQSFGRAKWLLQIQIHDCLARNYSLISGLIEIEIEKRRQMPKREQNADAVLRILLALKTAREPLGWED